jgi:hypothetical protein
VIPRLFHDLGGNLPEAIGTTLRRAAVGYLLALVIGMADRFGNRPMAAVADGPSPR